MGMPKLNASDNQILVNFFIEEKYLMSTYGKTDLDCLLVLVVDTQLINLSVDMRFVSFVIGKMMVKTIPKQTKYAVDQIQISHLLRIGYG